jgi:hypothetical protein
MHYCVIYNEKQDIRQKSSFKYSILTPLQWHIHVYVGTNKISFEPPCPPAVRTKLRQAHTMALF